MLGFFPSSIIHSPTLTHNHKSIFIGIPRLLLRLHHIIDHHYYTALYHFTVLLFSRQSHYTPHSSPPKARNPLAIYSLITITIQHQSSLHTKLSPSHTFYHPNTTQTSDYLLPHHNPHHHVTRIITIHHTTLYPPPPNKHTQPPRQALNDTSSTGFDKTSPPPTHAVIEADRPTEILACSDPEIKLHGKDWFFFLYSYLPLSVYLKGILIFRQTHAGRALCLSLSRILTRLITRSSNMVPGSWKD